MRTAIMSDIHANREAFEACLRDARSRGVDRMAFLGDFVGYGADPAWVVDTIMGLVSDGAIAVMGNHDHAVSSQEEDLNPDADVAMSWTRGQLGPEARRFLSNLPMKFEDGLHLYVHANAQPNRRWQYIDSPEAAAKALDSCNSQTVFCGHVHVPSLYGITATGKTVSFRPVTDVAIPLPRHRRWLAVLGAVGQPRDGNPAASYALLDNNKYELTYLRIPYDVETASKKILDAGLPFNLASRIRRGH